MIALDRSALVCDLAEYYHVYDMNDLPLETVAVLACGLPKESRMIRKVSKSEYDLQTLMTASILDYLAILVWFQTKDGHKNRNRPKSYVQILTGNGKEEPKQERSFSSPEEFEAERQRILQGMNGNGIRTGKSIRTDHTNDKGHKGAADWDHGQRSGRRRKKRRR